jgi:hypothetical protein
MNVHRRFSRCSVHPSFLSKYLPPDKKIPPPSPALIGGTACQRFPIYVDRLRFAPVFLGRQMGEHSMKLTPERSLLRTGAAEIFWLLIVFAFILALTVTSSAQVDWNSLCPTPPNRWIKNGESFFCQCPDGTLGGIVQGRFVCGYQRQVQPPPPFPGPGTSPPTGGTACQRFPNLC